MINVGTFNKRKATVCRADILSAALALHIQSLTCSISVDTVTSLNQDKTKLCHRTHAVVLSILDLCTTLICSPPLSNPETAVHVDTVHVTILGLLQALDVEASILNELGIWWYNGSRPPDYKTTRQHLQYSTSASRHCLECSVPQSLYTVKVIMSVPP